MSALLHYKTEGEGHPIVLIHGLFGNLDNLGILARELKKNYRVISVDLRNHGLSFHSENHSYPEMAQDVIHLIDSLQIEKFSLIGHSMGGKVAMKMASILAERVLSLVVLDMAPIGYTENRHDSVFTAIENVQASRPASRSEALEIMKEYITIEGVRQFLSKSLYKDNETQEMHWRFNAHALKKHYRNILGWNTIEPVSVPTLFIKGELSEYILPEHQERIRQQFPCAKAHVVTRTGHWLHAEKPKEVLRAISKFYAVSTNAN
ncbi:alpha/beta fold hydrolase [Vibrio salinus]|uniref:alpha/beta fold hydrolase n=1 Tax=Vibrio salinus TaxID=2899784 RepID=UPI001E591DFF|nr:alpha/beta fold hydrolase [Vibrio salinus]MCE0494548.1 alpha/beta fold hydrolase [Vibrio salinus]